MKSYLLSLFLIASPLFILHAQCITAFNDTRTGRNFFYILDNGIIVHQEELTPQSYKIGNDFVAYVDNQLNFKLFKNGRINLVQTFPPERYEVSDNMLLIENAGGYLHVLENRGLKYIGRMDEIRYSYGDDVVVFQDFLNTFTLYHKGHITAFENRTVTNFSANENVIGFVDPEYQYKIFMNGELHTIETGSPPLSIKIHRNIVAYIDFLRSFRIFYDGEVIELESFEPKSFQVGEDMVAYVNAQDQMKVFYKGEVTELLPFAPVSYSIKDNILVYTEPPDYFNVFYKGEIKRLTNYRPERFSIDNDILVYQNLDNELVGFINGEIKTISNETISVYELQNQAVFFYQIPNHVKVYCNGKITNVY